jgi:hypothetical protein
VTGVRLTDEENEAMTPQEQHELILPADAVRRDPARSGRSGHQGLADADPDAGTLAGEVCSAALIL